MSLMVEGIVDGGMDVESLPLLCGKQGCTGLIMLSGCLTGEMVRSDYDRQVILNRASQRIRGGSLPHLTNRDFDLVIVY